MQCTNCGQSIVMNSPYYRGGWNKTIFCSYICVQEMYRDLCTMENIDQTIERHNYSNRETVKTLFNSEVEILDGDIEEGVAKVMYNNGDIRSKHFSELQADGDIQEIKKLVRQAKEKNLSGNNYTSTTR